MIKFMRYYCEENPRAAQQKSIAIHVEEYQ